MFERILVAVDGSDSSRHALAEVSKLARKLGSELVVLHVVEDVVTGYGTYGADAFATLELASAEIIESQRAAADELVRTLAREVPDDLTATPMAIEAGGLRTAEAIAHAAREEGADLIALGTHGRRGLSRLFVGSVADGVVRASTVPVLLYRRPEPEEEEAPAEQG